jgi:hypothetical protein
MPMNEKEESGDEIKIDVKQVESSESEKEQEGDVEMRDESSNHISSLQEESFHFEGD